MIVISNGKIIVRDRPKRIFEKYCANRIRGYTSKVHLRGLRENQGFLTHVGG
ncbi:hypothetical protein GTQ43_07965 [Nostoc sp. KVJ3]|uniref:hypothetical protein n=1 Tax=Nostoc sp. KVJ3 TaxID=457945 RepID=UPI0022375DAC|nr:hypothetical protein [Nostoc sp. KVJ3]MCW5313742.1 hypothetical protein [Nostoc sp. KVJ3]